MGMHPIARSAKLSVWQNSRFQDRMIFARNGNEIKIRISFRLLFSSAPISASACVKNRYAALFTLFLYSFPFARTESVKIVRSGFSLCCVCKKRYAALHSVFALLSCRPGSQVAAVSDFLLNT